MSQQTVCIVSILYLQIILRLYTSIDAGFKSKPRGTKRNNSPSTKLKETM